MSTKDFQGPWKTFRMYTGQLYVIDRRGISVCQMRDQFFQGKFRGDKEANARLVAAAPELLESLEWLLAAHLNPEHASANGAAERAQKIINKVKGV